MKLTYKKEFSDQEGLGSKKEFKRRKKRSLGRVVAV